MASPEEMLSAQAEHFDVVMSDVPTAQTSSPSNTFSNNQPGFKYKYPQAKPTPDGEDDTLWNKIFTAADSRLYNKHGKNATESRKYRENGTTRELALVMLKEKKGKVANGANADADGGSVAPAPKTSLPKEPAKKLPPSTFIKKETSASSRDATPATDKMMMSIPEKIKSEGRARKVPSAAPSDNGAPAQAPSIATETGSLAPPPPTMSKVEKPIHKKKGTAAPVKKGRNPQIQDKVNTPSSSRHASQTPGPNDGLSSEDDSNDGREYCLCRGPDDHRMMIYCDGGCNDWYHCDCIGVKEADVKELLDRFYCPNCKTDFLFTTWKPMCRYFNVAKYLDDPAIPPCRKAAKVDMEPPSKYCSEEHKEEFWQFVLGKSSYSDSPARGGKLSAAEIGFMLNECNTADEVHALGKKPRLPIKEGADPNRHPGLDYLDRDQEEEMARIKLRKEEIQAGLQLYRNQEKLRVMVHERAYAAAHYLGMKNPDDICGYDNRLAFNEAEFARWADTEEGMTALETRILGPRSAESKTIRPHAVIADAPPVPDALDNLCTKKKCVQHLGWKPIHQDSFSYSHNLLLIELKALWEKETKLLDNAEHREATNLYYAENETRKYFRN